MQDNALLNHYRSDTDGSSRSLQSASTIPSPSEASSLQVHPAPWSADPAYATNAESWSILDPVGSDSSITASAPAVPALEAKKIPRPPNAWILYRSDCIHKMRAKMPEGAPKPTQADLSKQFGEQWRNEEESVKTRYERMAEAAREEHALKYPDWKFCRKQPKATIPNTSAAQSTTRAALQMNAPGPSKRARTTASAPTRPSPAPQQPSSTYNNAGEAYGIPIFPSVKMTHQPQSHQYYNNSGQQQQQQSSNTEYFFPPTQPRYIQSIRKPSIRPEDFRSYSAPDGFHETLARRSSSAVELFNVYDRPVTTGSLGTLPNADIPVGRLSPENSNIQINSGQQPSSSQFDSHGLGFYSTTKLLPFDGQTQSLPAFMPFGMNASPNLGGSGYEDVKGSGQPNQQFDMSQFTWLTPQTDPLPSQHQVNMPDWLLPFRNVRVKQDDMTGTPLLDLLTGLSASANAQAAESYIQQPIHISPGTGFAELNTDVKPSNPSYSFP